MSEATRTNALEAIALDDTHDVLVGRLPESLIPQRDGFETLWALHPAEFHELTMMGRRVKTPRWSQAYDRAYRYSGSWSEPLPLPLEFAPMCDWARDAIDPRLNGALVNWYDPARAHYIGPHRDSAKDMVVGAPIVTISLGGSRIFRVKPWRRAGVRVDLIAEEGTVVVLPWSANRAFTHEVPHRAQDGNRRLSITLRCFED